MGRTTRVVAGATFLLGGCLPGKGAYEVTPVDAPPVLGELRVSDLFPTYVGTVWRYHDVGRDGKSRVMRKGLAKCATVEFTDCQGETRSLRAVVQHTPGAEDDDYSYYDVGVDQSGSGDAGLRRVYQRVLDDEDELIGYDVFTPGFVRLMPPPYEPGRSEIYETTRCRCEKGDCTEKSLRHQHVVLGVRTVTSAAGTWVAVGIERRNLATGEIKRHWYAPGVGRVLEERLDEDGRVIASEALLRYRLGDHTCE